MRTSWLGMIEAACIAAWLGLAVVATRGQDDGVLVPLDASALAMESGSERWNGIFFQDQHVGYSVSRRSATRDGGTLYEQREQFQVAAFGKLQQIVTASAATVDAEGRVQRFDFFLAGDNVHLVARGEVRDQEVVIEINQSGETSTLSFPIARRPQLSLTLEDVLRRQTLAVGTHFTVPMFDPLTLSEGEMDVRVVDVTVLENGEEAWWLESSFHDMTVRALVLPTGETVRQEGSLGLSMVRMTKEEAQKLDTTAEPVDLIALSAVKLKGRLKHARETRVLAVRVHGVQTTNIPSQPPLQVLDRDVLRVEVPLWDELPRLPVRDPDGGAWLEATATLPSEHPDIVQKAAEIIGDAPDRREAVLRLNTWVHDHVEKVPTMGVPNGLVVLRQLQGDCNEHTALFVSLARAAGIPARIAAGVVYSDRITETGAFYYHAWPEVLLGGPTTWVPVDPTFGQAPADATHLKLVEGDLDRQVEIMGYLGRLSLELVENR